MSKVFYVGSAIANASQAKKFSERLTSLVYAGNLAFDNYGKWFDMDPVDQTSFESLRERAIYDMNGVTSAEFGVFIMPGGFGTHCEIGAFLAQGKPVYMYSIHPDGLLINNGCAPTYKCVFHYHPCINLFENEIDCFTAIIQAHFRK